MGLLSGTLLLAGVVASRVDPTLEAELNFDDVNVLSDGFDLLGEEQAPVSKLFAKFTSRPAAISSGDSLFLQASTGKMLSLEGNAVIQGAALVASDHLRTVRQSFVIEKPGGGTISGGDEIYLKSEASGNYLTIVGDSMRASAVSVANAAKIRVEKRLASGEYDNIWACLAHLGGECAKPQYPTTAGKTCHQAAGTNGCCASTKPDQKDFVRGSTCACVQRCQSLFDVPLVSNDTIFFKMKTGDFFKVTGITTKTVDSAFPDIGSRFLVSKEGTTQARCCATDGTMNLLDLNKDGQNGLSATKDECETTCSGFVGCKYFETSTSATAARCVGFSECPHFCDVDADQPHAVYRILEAFPPTNIAVGKPTNQSSVDSDASSGRAVDGSTAQTFSAGSCSMTKLEWQPWWRVDLSVEQMVSNVTVYNRADCCGGRLSNFDIRVGNAATWAENPACGRTSVRQGASINVECGHKAGRYVYITIIGRADVLTLCEVEVFSSGTYISRNVSEGQGLTNVSVYHSNLQVPNVVLANISLAPLYFEDTFNAGFAEGVKVAVAMSSGMLLNSESVQVLGIIPVTNFSKGFVPLTKNDTDPLAGNPPPTVQVNVKVQSAIMGGAVLKVAESLQVKTDNGYLASKLQERIEMLGIKIMEYKPTWLTKLTVEDFSVATTNTANCTWDKRCEVLPAVPMPKITASDHFDELLL